jgi:hypothetical protein
MICFAALALTLGCAQAGGQRFDLFIYDAPNGDAAYAISDGQHHAAIEVSASGEALLAPEPGRLVERLRTLPDNENDNIVTITTEGRNSRVHFGDDGDEPEDARDEEDEDAEDEDEPPGHDGSLVIVYRASVGDTRRFIGSLEQASPAMRDRMSAALGL